MSEEGYRVVLSGAIQEGYDLAQIQAAFASLFNIPEKKAKAFLRADNAVVKNDISEADARELASQLEAIGIIPEVISLSDNSEEFEHWEFQFFSAEPETKAIESTHQEEIRDEYSELESFALVEPDLSKQEMEKEVAWLLDDIEPVNSEHSNSEKQYSVEECSEHERSEDTIGVLAEMDSLVEAECQVEEELFAEEALIEGGVTEEGLEENFNEKSLVEEDEVEVDPFEPEEKPVDDLGGEAEERSFLSENSEADFAPLAEPVSEPISESPSFFDQPVVVAPAGEDGLQDSFFQENEPSREDSDSCSGFHRKQSVERYTLSFMGDGVEYFKIWIVNLIFSILSLGVYSAWASVRNKQYLYRNTRLNDSPFAYLGNPVVILQSRLLMVLGFLSFMILSGHSVYFDAVLWLVVISSIPFVIRKSIQYSESVTMWKGLRFGFDGDLLGAYKAFLFWPLAALLTLGLLIPLARYKQIEYVVCNSYYGNLRFQMKPFLKDYFLMFLKAMGFVLVGGAISYGVVLVLSPSLGSFLLMAAYFGGFVFYSVRAVNMMYNHVALCEGEVTFEANYQDVAFAEKFLLNTLFTFFSLGFYYPWAIIHRLQYQTEHLVLVSERELGEMPVAEHEKFLALVEKQKQMIPLERVIYGVVSLVGRKNKTAYK
ncbi:MAG: DUF898 domain-containing protein [Cellvibrionaceae bacterium]